ncbi:MAG: hypothetical protein QW334_03855 [Thermofilum sp.]
MPEGELEKLIAEGDEPGPEGGDDALLIDKTPPSPYLHKNELKLLALILRLRYKTKAALASDLDVGEWTVTRYLLHFEKLGLIQDGERLHVDAGEAQAGRESKNV